METAIGALGRFPLLCIAGRSWRREFEANLVLRRNGHDQIIPIDDDLTPMGLISRLEYQLDRFEFDLHEQERRARDADTRCAGYEDRAGQVFPLQTELDAKLAALAALNAELAQTTKQAA